MFSNSGKREPVSRLHITFKDVQHFRCNHSVIMTVLPDSPELPLPPTSVDDDTDGISEHRLAPYIAHYYK